MEYYGVRECDAKKTLNSTSSLRLLNMLAMEAGLITDVTCETIDNANKVLHDKEEAINIQMEELKSLQEQIDQEKEELEKKEADIKVLLSELNTQRLAFEDMETQEMRDRVRALEYFKGCFDHAARQRNSYIQGCATILAGQYVVVPNEYK